MGASELLVELSPESKLDTTCSTRDGRPLGTCSSAENGIWDGRGKLSVEEGRVGVGETSPSVDWFCKRYGEFGEGKGWCCTSGPLSFQDPQSRYGRKCWLSHAESLRWSRVNGALIVLECEEPLPSSPVLYVIDCAVAKGSIMFESGRYLFSCCPVTGLNEVA